MDDWINGHYFKPFPFILSSLADSPFTEAFCRSRYHHRHLEEVISLRAMK